MNISQLSMSKIVDPNKKTWLYELPTLSGQVLNVDKAVFEPKTYNKNKSK